MKNNMSAEQLFEKIGYEKTTCGNSEYFEKYFDLGWARIIFDREKKTLYITYDSGFSLYEYTIEQMEDEEKEAIDQRLKELGWLFGSKRKYCFDV